jgi:hypothetical protein
VMPLGEEDHFRLRAGFKSTAHECRRPVMSAPIMSNSVAGGPSEPNKYSVDDSGVEIATGDPAAGGLYLRGLAREGVALRREILRFLTRLRSQSGRAPVDFTRCTMMLS